MWPLIAYLPALTAGIVAAGSAAMALRLDHGVAGGSPERRLESSTYGIFAIVALVAAALLLVVAFAAIGVHELAAQAQSPGGGGAD